MTPPTDDEVAKILLCIWKDQQLQRDQKGWLSHIYKRDLIKFGTTFNNCHIPSITQEGLNFLKDGNYV